jgi:hypothetical protein
MVLEKKNGQLQTRTAYGGLGIFVQANRFQTKRFF